MKQGVFSRDFILVVLGQIISLFGNATIRFVLPLYLLNYTGSSALFGMVTACAFIPTIILSPIGGIVADRVNKRNIMVILDFITSIVIIAWENKLGSFGNSYINDPIWHSRGLPAFGTSKRTCVSKTRSIYGSKFYY